MAELALIATAVGTGISAYGQYQQGQAASAEGKVQKKLYEYNARVAEMQAKEAQTKALYEANLHRRQTRALIGRQRAAMAAGGLSLDTGSPLALLEETASLSETDAQMILREGMISRQSFESEAFLNRAQGKVASARGRNARKASLWQAGGTILSGAGLVVSQGYDMGWFKPKFKPSMATTTGYHIP